MLIKRSVSLGSVIVGKWCVEWSVGHEILNAYKYIIKISGNLAQISLECYFFLHINVKMPTTVGILTFMSRKKFMLS